MGFLSNIFGTNQKYSTSKLSGQYNKAYQPARDAYNEISGIGRQMMDADSDFNQNRRSMMEAQGADRAAEAARMGQRMAAMSGGAPAAAMAAQAGATTNKTMADSQSAFNQYLQGAMGQGVGMLSSSANNLSSMAENQMNAVNAQRLANARIDSQASGAMASLAGTALGGIGTALGGPAGGMGAKLLTGLFAQEGGMIPDDEEGYMYGGKVKYNKGGEVSSYLIDEQGNGKNLVKSLIHSRGFEDEDEMYDYQESTSSKKGKEYQIIKDKDGRLIKYPTTHYGGMLSGVRNLAGQLMGPKEIDELPKMMKHGGAVYGKGGMLSQIMGPKGPMNIPTRMGGYKVG